MSAPPLHFLYRNHRGVTEWRRVEMMRWTYGSTEWHPEEQWFLQAFDIDRKAERHFALDGILCFEGRSPSQWSSPVAILDAIDLDLVASVGDPCPETRAYDEMGLLLTAVRAILAAAKGPDGAS